MLLTNDQGTYEKRIDMVIINALYYINTFVHKAIISDQQKHIKLDFHNQS